MSIADWPEGVPTEVLRQGYTEEDEDDMERFKPEKGPEITWESPSTFTTIFRVTIECNNWQKRLLNDFYRINRAMQFRRPDPGTGELARFKFISPIQWSQARYDCWYGATAFRRMP